VPQSNPLHRDVQRRPENIFYVALMVRTVSKKQNMGGAVGHVGLLNGTN
jgi:hypothetical protein